MIAKRKSPLKKEEQELLERVRKLQPGWLDGLFRPAPKTEADKKVVGVGYRLTRSTALCIQMQSEVLGVSKNELVEYLLSAALTELANEIYITRPELAETEEGTMILAPGLVDEIVRQNPAYLRAVEDRLRPVFGELQKEQD